MATVSYGEENDTNLKLMITLIRCFQSVRRAEEGWIKEHGLTLPQFMALEFLYHKGEVNVGELIEKTHSTPGTMTVVIDNLAKDGFIIKERDKNDKRSFVLKITDRGTELMSRFFPIHMCNIGERFKVLDENEKKQMIELCKKLGKGL